MVVNPYHMKANQVDELCPAIPGPNEQTPAYITAGTPTDVTVKTIEEQNGKR